MASPDAHMKYVVVSGGVISGVGKGIISSSIGALLKAQGLRVTSIKIDPYLNIDAGTFSPYEHGEVYVLDDGGEADLDLGNYERFLDCTLHRDNNITTGKIYQEVITRERRGDYLGKTVQVVPHVTNQIQEWVERVAQKCVDGSGQKPDVCVIELGGTVGDIESMPFVEAFRQFQFKVGKENIMFLHVSLVPATASDKEQKTKPTQHSVRELRGLGLSPDMIVCRSQKPLVESVKRKISNFCHVPAESVISVHDCASIYRVPLLLDAQNVIPLLEKHLGLPVMKRVLSDEGFPMHLNPWKSLADRYENLRTTVKIVLVGKYTGMSDAYASVNKALLHSCLMAGYKLDLQYVEAGDLEDATLKADPTKYHDAWGKICSGQGILVPGGFGSRGIEGKLLAVKWARERKIPYLGICLGLQVAAIEFARNVLGWEDANTTEVNPDCEHKVVIDMPEISTKELGGTMRLGKRKTIFVQPDCVTKKLYFDAETIEERHRHRYEINPALVGEFEKHGMQFVGKDTEGERMEILELDDHPYFVACQFHPEYLSRPYDLHRAESSSTGVSGPSPVFNGLILAAVGKLQTWLKRRPDPKDMRFSAPGSPARGSRPSWMYEDSPPTSPDKTMGTVAEDAVFTASPAAQKDASKSEL